MSNGELATICGSPENPSGADPSDTVLSIRDLCMGYPRPRRFREALLHPFQKETVQALRNVSLDIGRGQIMVVVGANGAGKSTLCRILAGLVSPGAGQIVFEGACIQRIEQLRGRVGFCINDERSFLWPLSGLSNLQLFASLCGLHGRLAARKIDELLDLLGIASARDLPFMYYSTGMRQRLNVARSLLVTAPLLVLDEPTRSLDPVAAQDLVRYVQSEVVDVRGASVVWCTHIVSEAESLAGTIVVLRDGELVVAGTREDILRYVRAGGVSSAPGPSAQSPVDSDPVPPHADHEPGSMALAKAIRSLCLADHEANL